MKILFLDVDGVLNSKLFFNNNQTEMIDRTCVQLLKRIIDQTGAYVVLSSGWRLWFDDAMIPEAGDAQYLCDIFCKHGITLYRKTPDYSTAEIREKRTFSHVKAKEILAWLKEHDTVEKYVVLDDLDLKNEEINQHLVQIDGTVGMTENDVKRIVDILNSTTIG